MRSVTEKSVNCTGCENKQARYTHGGDWCGDGSIRLDFSVNINPFGLPESGRKAYIDSISRLARYPDWDCRALRQALGNKLQLLPEHIFCGNGAAELIDRIVRALHPRRAVLAVPAFSEYERALRVEGCEITYFPLCADKDFVLSQDFLEFLTVETDMVFLCNPNNPTGRLIDRDLLFRIQERCEEQQIWLVVDECFLEFTGKEKEQSLIGRLASKTIVLRAFTKIYAMPGLRLGYLVCGNGDAMQRIFQAGQCWNVSVPAQSVGIAVLSEEAYVRESVACVQREREFLMEGLRTEGFGVVPSETNFILFFSRET
ncbi:MAG: aminotransferase class I/II-fold pyridoxal phosphate-dependent enzyme, partial [Lachnospiraceae bacterium]|nr:aminotransferase class I/II-fold pyridoxal phosphate-dependent enzyme [Lachnospiraceae bacterium]